MSLSEREQRALREIEQSLFADDPRFVASVGRNENVSNFMDSRVTLRGIALVVVGLVLLIGGVALAQSNLWFVALSVVGFLLMFGSGIWMLRGGDSSAYRTSSVSGGTKKPGGASSDSSSFGQRMEDNFRQRFQGQ